MACPSAGTRKSAPDFAQAREIGEIGMGQRLTLIAVEKNDVAGFGLLFAPLQAQAHPFHLAFRLTSLQRVPGPPPAELFFARPWTVANG